MRKKERFGRSVISLEVALQQTVKGCKVVCDDCLLNKQPLPRTDTAWARRRKDRVPLCARNGWCCPLQARESDARHTENLKPDGLSEYLRAKVGIPPYAGINSVCKSCHKEFMNAKVREYYYCYYYY